MTLMCLYYFKAIFEAFLRYEVFSVLTTRSVIAKSLGFNQIFGRKAVFYFWNGETNLQLEGRPPYCFTDVTAYWKVVLIRGNGTVSKMTVPSTYPPLRIGGKWNRPSDVAFTLLSFLSNSFRLDSLRLFTNLQCSGHIPELFCVTR